MRHHLIKYASQDLYCTFFFFKRGFILYLFTKILLFCLKVKLNPWLLEDINDDIEFALKLAKEESVIVTPGKVLKIFLFF